MYNLSHLESPVPTLQVHIVNNVCYMYYVCYINVVICASRNGELELNEISMSASVIIWPVLIVD